MTYHESLRYEPRQSNHSVPQKVWDNRNETPLDCFPCLADCKLDHEHHGRNVFIYAKCSCGWEVLVGDHLYESEVILKCRLAHLEHRFQVLEDIGIFSKGKS